MGLLIVSTIGAAAPPPPTAVDFIPGDRYVDTLLPAVNGATASIVCYMYVYSLHRTNPQSPTMRLADALIAAAGRGVKVEVILNGRKYIGDEEPEFLNDRNTVAAEYLMRGGVPVFFEDAPALLHAKTVIIDDAVVLLGSSNWSSLSFTKNLEANLLVRDAPFAKKVRMELGEIPRSLFKSEDADAVALPAAFLTNARGIGRMSRRRAETSFDVYAGLLRESQKQGQPKRLKVNLEQTADFLGKAHLPRQEKRFLVSRTLRELRDQYHLISVDFNTDGDADVAVAPLSGETVTLPQEYWTYGWDRRLGFPGKIMFLLGRYYSERSPTRPRWMRSKFTLEREHGVSESTLDRGTVELKRANLWEVRNSPISTIPGARKPNEYTPNPLYDPRVWEERKERLTARYGREKVDRAALIAVDFYEDRDLAAIEALVNLENEFGQEKVARAVRQVGAKRPGNPKRNIGYLITVIQNPERPDTWGKDGDVP